MNGRETERMRERALFLYFCALETGDAEIIENVLTMAETDPTLADMLMEVEAHYANQQQANEDSTKMERIRGLLRQHLASAYISENGEEEAPPLTIGDVTARIKTDTTTGQLASEAAYVAQMAAHTPLPQQLTKPSIRRLFEQLGITISRAFADQFRNIGIEMQMRRERQMMRLAAARKQNSNSVSADTKRKTERDEPEQQS